MSSIASTLRPTETEVDKVGVLSLAFYSLLKKRLMGPESMQRKSLAFIEKFAVVLPAPHWTHFIPHLSSYV